MSGDPGVPTPRQQAGQPSVSTTAGRHAAAYGTRNLDLGALTTLVTVAPVGLAVLDDDLHILFVNPAMAEVALAVGSEVGALGLIGSPLADLLPELAEWVEPACRSVLTTGRAVPALEVTGGPPTSPSLGSHWQMSIRLIAPDGDHRARLALAIQDVTARTHDLVRLSALVTVTAALSGAHRLDDVLRIALTEATVAVGGAAASVGLLNADTQSLRTINAGFPAVVAAEFDRLACDAMLPGPAVFRDGHARHFVDQAEVAAQFPDAAAVVQGTPYQAAAVEPLQVRDIRVGYLAVHFTEAGPLSNADRKLLAALAGQCAIAVDRARVADAERTERDVARQLQALASKLAVAASVDDVARAMGGQASALLGATSTVVDVYDAETRSLSRVLVSTGSDVTRRPTTATAALKDAFATGQPVLLRSTAEAVRRYPSDDGSPGAQQAWAHLPLQASGHPLGVATFGWDAPRSFPADELELIRVVADLCSGALERARLADAQHPYRRDAAACPSATQAAPIAGMGCRGSLSAGRRGRSGGRRLVRRLRAARWEGRTAHR